MTVSISHSSAHSYLPSYRHHTPINIIKANLWRENHACDSSKHAWNVWRLKWDQGERNGQLVRSNSNPPDCESCLTSGLPTRWCACNLPHCAIDLDVAFWYDYLSPAWMYWGREAFWVSSLVVGSQSDGCVHFGTDLAGCASALEISSSLRGPSPQAFTPFRGLGLLLGTWGAPNKGNADGAKGIFSNAGCVLAMALRLDPP